MQTTESLVRRLPDAYAKEPESNNYKLLSINHGTVEEIYQDLMGIDATNDLLNASGKTLDLYGQMLGCNRGASDDTQYRTRILTTIARIFSDGSNFKVRQLLAVALNYSWDKFWLVDSGTAKVRIEELTIEALVRSGLTIPQFKEVFKALIPVGVAIDDYSMLLGTFEFSEDDNVLDKSKGFADLAETYGGYLSAHLTDEDVSIHTGLVGTLEFADGAYSYDKATGFADSTGTFGGYFGSP